MGEAGPAGVNRPSVTAPIDDAFRWTGKVLFGPFDIGKWFTLGFCAWLAWLGEGGGGTGFNRAFNRVDDGVDGTVGWIRDHWSLFLGLAVAGTLVVLALVVLLTWLSSRGKFMFLDGVIHDRGAVVDPWHRFRDAAWSLFLFRLVVGLAAFFAFVLLACAMFTTVWGAGFDEGLASRVAWLALVAWMLVIGVLGIAFGLINLAVTDFVVPIMWLRGVRVMEAWAELRALAAGRLGTFVAYVLMKILIALATVVISCAAVFVTCCIVAIPYLGTVLLLPLFVFNRSYSIHFLSRFGPDYASLAPVYRTAEAGPPAPPTPPSGLPPGPPPTPPAGPADPA